MIVIIIFTALWLWPSYNGLWVIGENKQEVKVIGQKGASPCIQIVQRFTAIKRLLYTASYLLHWQWQITNAVALWRHRHGNTLNQAWASQKRMSQPRCLSVKCQRDAEYSITFFVTFEVFDLSPTLNKLQF